MILKNLFKNTKSSQDYNQLKMLDGYSPVFSRFGQNIYSSDVVQMCIDVIATECSKLKPKHIRIDGNDMQSTVNSSITKLFKFAPNELMTTRDFIEKVIWLLYLNFNAFIYPMYEIKTDSDGHRKREYTKFYPLNPETVTFLQDNKDEIFIEMRFANGEKFVLAYDDVIHLRKKFSMNDVMGGGFDGKPDHAALMKVLNINDSVMQGMEKAIKTSLSIRGIININSMMDDAAKKAERDKFEAAIASGKTGIMAMDLKGDYIDVKPDPKIIDKETLDFLQNKVLNYYGVSLPILSGDFNDEQYQAFYEKTLEPLVISLGQAFSSTLFSKRELDFGNEIVFYQKDMMYLSTTAKLNLIKNAGEQGILSDNQKLALLGYPPIPGGDRITQSLNYIDKSLINSYQMNRKSDTNGGINENE